MGASLLTHRQPEIFIPDGASSYINSFCAFPSFINNHVIFSNLGVIRKEKYSFIFPSLSLLSPEHKDAVLGKWPSVFRLP